MQLADTMTSGSTTTLLLILLAVNLAMGVMLTIWIIQHPADTRSYGEHEAEM